MRPAAASQTTAARLIRARPRSGPDATCDLPAGRARDRIRGIRPGSTGLGAHGCPQGHARPRVSHTDSVRPRTPSAPIGGAASGRTNVVSGSARREAADLCASLAKGRAAPARPRRPAIAVRAATAWNTIASGARRPSGTEGVRDQSRMDATRQRRGAQPASPSATARRALHPSIDGNFVGQPGDAAQVTYDRHAHIPKRDCSLPVAPPRVAPAACQEPAGRASYRAM